jgi:hypothetical protein
MEDDHRDDGGPPLPASAATAAPVRIDATFSFLRVGAPDFESSSFSGLGDASFFIPPPGEPGFLGSVSFDIIDGDIHAEGTFFFSCSESPCAPGDAGFRYKDPIISTGVLFTEFLLVLEPGSFGAEFPGPFSGGPGIVIQVGFVSGTTSPVLEPSAFVLLTSAIAALAAIGVKRRRSA